MRDLSTKTKYSTNTLKTWKKEQLIQYIRDLEYNYKIVWDTIEQQARNMEQMIKEIRPL